MSSEWARRFLGSNLEPANNFDIPKHHSLGVDFGKEDYSVSMFKGPMASDNDDLNRLLQEAGAGPAPQNATWGSFAIYPEMTMTGVQVARAVSDIVMQEVKSAREEEDIRFLLELQALQIQTEAEEGEWEIVARTTTSTSRRRRTTTPGRATVSGPTTKNDPIYTWAMQSSKPRNGGEYIQYEVRLNDDGSVSCNCPGWIFKKNTATRGCKHTRHEQIVKDATDFFLRHQRGEQLPTIMPTEEQAARAMGTRAGRAATVAGKDTLQGFGRFIELED